MAPFGFYAYILYFSKVFKDLLLSFDSLKIILFASNYFYQIL